MPATNPEIEQPKMIIFRPADPESDFAQLAAWFSLIEDEPTSEAGLRAYYEKSKERIVQRVAMDERGELLGFYWLGCDRVLPERLHCSLFVKPDSRRQGVGGRLFVDLERAAAAMQAKTLRFAVRDNDPDGKAFAERRGFQERAHQTAWALDLASFDDRLYLALIERLQDDGFRFTSMEELSNSVQAQRKLYALNKATGLDIPGAGGEPSWASFEDFQEYVCGADWYKPGGQKVVIDVAKTGDDGPFVALSAITRFEGADYAYNLHTGVGRDYRGRKLAQAVKVTALRYARDVLLAGSVHTHHNAENLPMIAIDRKFGYVQTPGMFSLEKKVG